MFDILNNILYKQNTIDITNIDENTDFQPYLIQRWCSMYSPALAHLVNQTSNVHWSVLQEKSEWYMYLHTVVPKNGFKRYGYIKKKKETPVTKEQKDTVQKIANTLEISKREINLYIEQFNLQIPNEKK